MIRVAFFLLLTVVSSCSHKESEAISVNEEQLLPKSEYVYNDSLKTEQQVVLPLSKDDSLLNLIKRHFPLAKRYKEKQSLFPNRFNYEFKDVVSLDGNERLYYWWYKDEAQTLNVFYNWLDCIGESCISLKIGETSTKQIVSPFAIWVSSRLILYLDFDTNVDHYELNGAFKTIFKQQNWLFACYQKSNDSLVWVKKGLN